MSKIYAVIGTNSMTVVADSVRYNPQTNEVLMQSERPSDGDYVASEDGTWKKDEPTTEEKLAALDAQYNADKSNLLNAYQTALVYGNADRMEQIKSDLVALDGKYDADYGAIVGEE